MDIQYRAANDKDIKFILDILKSVSGDIKEIKPEQFLVAADGEKVVGCIRIKNVEGCFVLASFAVLPEYGRNGIGATLVTKIIEQNTARPIYIFSNVKNKTYYEKFGFKIVKIENLPEVIKKDYFDLLNRNFFNDKNTLIAMILNS